MSLNKLNSNIYSNICLSICSDDIYCRRKRCPKLHNERKRFNICKFDIFFIPYEDNGCHFEDCVYVHPKREAFYIQKEKDFDNTVISVFNHLELDDDTPIINDWKILMRNIHGNDFDELYEELYSYYLIINKLSFQLEALQFHYSKSYMYYLENILSNIYVNYQKFNKLLKYILIRYDEHKEDFIILYNKVEEDIEYITMYKENAKKMLYQTCGININF